MYTLEVTLGTPSKTTMLAIKAVGVHDVWHMHTWTNTPCANAIQTHVLTPPKPRHLKVIKPKWTKASRKQYQCPVQVALNLSIHIKDCPKKSPETSDAHAAPCQKQRYLQSELLACITSDTCTCFITVLCGLCHIHQANTYTTLAQPSQNLDSRQR